MAKNFLVPINLNQNELQNAVLQPLATAPSNGVLGQIYFNSSDKKLYQHNGTSWEAVNKETYTLPVATSSVLGGVKSGGDITVASNGAVTVNDADKVNGHTVEIDVPSNAKFTDTVYTHPTTAGNKHIPSGGASGNILGYDSAGTAKWITPSKSTVGLGNVDNTSDANKPISTAAQEALNAKAPLASPALTGTPTAPTASAGTNTTQIATTAFVATAISNGIAASDAMIFKGTLGTGGTVTALPTTYKIGWTYRVITAGTYAGATCEVGDLIIALVDRTGSGNANSDWTIAQTNINGALTNVTGTSPISVSGSGSSRAISHANSGATAGSYGTSANKTIGLNTTVLTFDVPYVKVNSTGHVIEISNKTITIDEASLLTGPERLKISGLPQIASVTDTIPADTTSYSIEFDVCFGIYSVTAMDAVTFEPVVLDWALTGEHTSQGLFGGMDFTLSSYANPIKIRILYATLYD